MAWPVLGYRTPLVIRRACRLGVFPCSCSESLVLQLQLPHCNTRRVGVGVMACWQLAAVYQGRVYHLPAFHNFARCRRPSVCCSGPSILVGVGSSYEYVRTEVQLGGLRLRLAWDHGAKWEQGANMLLIVCVC